MSKYEHLVGKWVKVVHQINGADVGEWLQVERSVGDDRLVVVFREGMGLSEDVRNWYISPFDFDNPKDYNPDEYEEVRIPFDFERWQKGDYVRVETNDGNEVTELRYEEKASYPLKGVEQGYSLAWRKDGSYFTVGNNDTKDSLSLIVLQPKVKEEQPTLKVDNDTTQTLNITDERVVKSATANPSTFVMGSGLNELVVNFEGYTLTVEGNKATFTKTTQQ